MSYDPTNSDQFSELLSAYLDGELTADEQALVEQRLAENTEFRQLHDELRALRSGLESLPRYRLKEDLAASVLRRAERAMLSAPAVAPAANVAPEAKQVSLAEELPVSERVLRGLRAFRWSIVALAVALLIMVFNPGKDEDGREVAFKTKQGAQDLDVQGKDTAAAPSDLAMQAKESGSADAFGMQERQALRKSAAGEGSSFAAPPMSANRALPPAETRSFEANAKKRERSDLSDKFAEDRIAGDRGVAEEAAPAAGVAAPMHAESLAAPGRAAARFSGNTGAKAGRDSRPSQDGSVAGGRGQAVGGPVVADLRNGAAVAGPLGNSADGLLIVQCDISPEAARSGAFAQLLAEQQIALFDGEQNLRRNRRSKADDQPADFDAVGTEAGDAATAEPAPAAELKDSTGKAKNGTADKKAPGEKETAKQFAAEAEGVEADRAQGGWADAPQLDAVLVEASPEQIAATFAGLQSRTEEFYSLNFQPPQPSVTAEKAQLQHKSADALVADEALPPEAVAEPGDDKAEKAAEEADAELEPANKLEAGKTEALSRGLKSNTFRAMPAEAQLEAAGGLGGGGGGAANFAAGAGGFGAAGDFSGQANAQRVPINAEQFRQLAPQVAPLAKGAAGSELHEPAAPVIQSQEPRVQKLTVPNAPAAPAKPQAEPQAAPLAADAPAPIEQAIESIDAAVEAPRDAQLNEPAAARVDAIKPGLAARKPVAPPVRVLFLFRVVPAKQ